ncbi:hypothetical protein BJX99DRAFT_265131 [Aspergillus californicus]
MTTFHFNGQPLDTDLATSISSLLDAVDVPNLLWGNYLLTVYGIPTIVDDVCFVVPDALVELSFSTLAKAGFRPCSHFDCPHSDSRRPVYKHLHINDELAVSLYRKSDVLGEFPDFGTVFHDTPNSDIMYASDARLPSATWGRGRGRFPKITSVRIPSAVRYCEALILLLSRDDGNARWTYWMAILTYIMEFVDETDIFDEESLSDRYKHFYHALKSGDPMAFSILKDLRLDFETRRLQVA